jgi:SOS-response transcriptional repressor LexA
MTIKRTFSINKAMNWSREHLLPMVKEKMSAKGIDSYAELARLTGVKDYVLKDWFSGKARMLRGDNLAALVSSLEIGEPLMSLPYLGEIPCGQPVVISQRTIERATRLTVPHARPNWLFLRARGDSMNLVAPDGVLLAVNPIFDSMALDGKYVVVNYNGEATMKRYRANPMVMLEPRSSNPTHEVIVPQAGDELQIQGVVEMVINDFGKMQVE